MINGKIKALQDSIKGDKMTDDWKIKTIDENGKVIWNKSLLSIILWCASIMSIIIYFVLEAIK